MKSELKKEIKQEADEIIEDILESEISMNKKPQSVTSIIAKTDFTESTIKRIAKLKIKAIIYEAVWGE